MRTPPIFHPRVLPLRHPPPQIDGVIHGAGEQELAVLVGQDRGDQTLVVAQGAGELLEDNG